MPNIALNLVKSLPRRNATLRSFVGFVLNKIVGNTLVTGVLPSVGALKWNGESNPGPLFIES